MKYIVTIAFLLLSTYSFCQEHKFAVLNVKGDVTVSEAGKKIPAKIGQWLNGNEEITVADKGEVTLICKSEGYVLLNKKGLYKPADYNKCQPGKTNILSNYMKFCWEEFSHHHEDGTKAEAQHRMENVGAAVRGGSKCFVITDSLFNMVNYCEGSFALSWKKNTNAALRLKIFEYPDGGPAVIDVAVTNDSYEMTQLTGQLKKGTDYFWTLVPANRQEECQRHHLQIWDKADYELLLQSYKNEAATMTTDKANEAYMLGYLLESSHFYAEAINYYKEAIKLAPKNELYVTSLNTLQKRTGPGSIK